MDHKERPLWAHNKMTNYGSQKSKALWANDQLWVSKIKASMDK